jgi:hypothetical protein
MLGKWEDATAAAPHATSIDREEHSVTKGYGAQTRRQHNKAMSQNSLSICGKRLLDLYDNSQGSRSEINKSRRSINGSGYEINSQRSLFSERDKPCEDNNSSSPKQRLALHRYRSFRMADSNTARDSASDVCVDFPPTSINILGLTEVLKGSKKWCLRKVDCRVRISPRNMIPWVSNQRDRTHQTRKLRVVINTVTTTCMFLE